MNRLLKKLHVNKVNMEIIPFDLYNSNAVHIKFDKGIHRKRIQIDLEHLFKCEVDSEDIIILELEAFLNEAGMEVQDESM